MSYAERSIRSGWTRDYGGRRTYFDLNEPDAPYRVFKKDYDEDVELASEVIEREGTIRAVERPLVKDALDKRIRRQTYDLRRIYFAIQKNELKYPLVGRSPRDEDWKKLVKLMKKYRDTHNNLPKITYTILPDGTVVKRRAAAAPATGKVMSERQRKLRRREITAKARETRERRRNGAAGIPTSTGEARNVS